MALVLTIGGVVKELKAGSLRISQTANGRATASFVIMSTDASYRPSIDAEVIFTEDGSRIFGGLAQRPEERGLFSNGALVGIATTLSAVDFNAYADRRAVNGIMPAGTMKAHLLVLENSLLQFGVSLADWPSAQVDGPALPELVHEYVMLAEVLNEIATLTAAHGEPYVWRIDEFKTLSMYQPSTVAAPFNILTDSPAQVIGDIEVTSTREHYANSIIVLTRLTPPAVGEPVPIGVDFNLPIFALASDAGEIATVGYWEKVIRIESVPDQEAAQARADAELAAALSVYHTVKYRTLEPGVRPGQTQTITVPKRNVDVSGMISDVVTSDFGTTRLMRDVTVQIDDSQTNLGKGWRDVYKKWSEDITGKGTVPSGTLATGSAAPPNTAVQWNNNGVFGGEIDFTYNATTNSLVCGGGGSSITSIASESCQVFGSNCHIADP